MSAHLEGEQLETVELSPSEAAHVAACASCQAARRDAAARRKLTGGLTPYTLSDMAFRRVEARLMEQVEQGLPDAQPLWRRLWWLGPVVAALGLLVWVSVHLPDTAPALTSVGPAPVAFAAAHTEPLTVLQASAGSRVQRGAWQPVHAGDVLAAGEAFTGDLRLAPASATAWTFEVSGSAAIGGVGSLTLGVGEVLARVQGTEATIAASGLQVIATEAVFLVSSTAAEVLVEVAEGEVSLSDASVARRTVLKAPARVRWAPGSKPVSLPVVGVTVQPAPPKPWVRFDAEVLPPGTRLSLDGLDVGAAPLSLLVGLGKHHVGTGRPGEALTESWVDLTGDYRLPQFEAPAHDAPPPDAAALQRVQAELARNTPRLAACYEKWLKENPNATGDVELHLVVSETGKVKRAEVVGAALSRASAECLVRTAKALTLPPLGSEVELALPVKLTTTH